MANDTGAGQLPRDSSTMRGVSGSIRRRSTRNDRVSALRPTPSQIRSFRLVYRLFRCVQVVLLANLFVVVPCALLLILWRAFSA